MLNEIETRPDRSNKPLQITSDQVYVISLLCYIVGQSSTLKEIASRTRSGSLAKLLSTLRKLGAYFRGLEILYAAVMDSRLNQKCQALQIRRVEPRSNSITTPSCKPDWYKVCNVIYHWTRGRGLLVSPSQVATHYPEINKYHETWSDFCARHAEVILVDYLTILKRAPSEIGVSKLSCHCCHVWF